MKFLINIAFLKKQIKRYWLISAISMLIYLLGVVLPLHIVSHFWGNITQAQMMVDILSMMHPVLLILTVLIPFFTAMLLHSYNFKGVDIFVFENFRFTKNQLFWTNFMAGSILIILPILILCLILLIPINISVGYYEPMFYSRGLPRLQISVVQLPYTLFPEWLAEGEVINTFRHVVGFFARTVLGFMFYFAMFLIAVSATDSKVIAVFLSITISLFTSDMLRLFRLIGSLYVFGMSDLLMHPRPYDISIYTNPLFWSDLIRSAGRTTPPGVTMVRDEVNLLSYFMIYLAIAVALLAIAYLCSVARKQKQVGDFIVLTPNKNVLVILLSTVSVMTGTVEIARIMLLITGNRFGWYLGLLLGFIIAYFISQMIAGKTFNIYELKTKSLGSVGAIMIGLYALMFFIVSFSVESYVNKVPQQADVYSVSLSYGWRWHMGYVTDDEIISSTIDLHKEILNNREYFQQLSWIRMSRFWGDSHLFPLVYVLHDGTRIYRRYDLPRDFIRVHQIWHFLSHPKILLAEKPFLQAPENVYALTMAFGYHEQDIDIDTMIIRNQTQIESLIEAIRTDYLREIVAREELGWAGEQLTRIKIDVWLYSEFSPNRFSNDWLRLSLFADGEIIKWLTEHGYMK